MSAAHGSRSLVVCVASVAAMLLVACTSSSVGPGNGQDAAATDADTTCPVTAPTACPSPPVVWDDIADTVARRCAEPCHSGKPDGPWPLTNKMHVADWGPQVRDELVACAMPPPDSGVVLTSAERLAILTWVRCGLM